MKWAPYLAVVGSLLLLVVVGSFVCPAEVDHGIPGGGIPEGGMP